MRPPFALGWGTVVAIAVLLAVVIAALFAAQRHPAKVLSRPAAIAPDPVLERCNNAGMDALNDPVCQAAWKAAREHFLGQTRSARP